MNSRFSFFQHSHSSHFSIVMHASGQINLVRHTFNSGYHFIDCGVLGCGADQSSVFHGISHRVRGESMVYNVSLTYLVSFRNHCVALF